VPAQQEGLSATLSNAIFAIPSLHDLKDSINPAYKEFSEKLQLLRDLRNTESHGSINISEEMIDAAIRVVIDMYLYVTATNILDLEMAGYYPVEEETATIKPIAKEESIDFPMAADSRVE
jgi:type I restriction enzyme R subunit